MNKPALLSLSLVAAAVLAGNAQAEGFQFGKPIESTAIVTTNTPGFAAGTETKTVTVMDVKLTPAQRKLYTTFPSTNSLAGANPHPSLYPSHLDLGMNKVPVLDQGRHGSCVTFAVTGAVDALLEKGDYVSQLCSLELGSTIQKDSYTYSGWNGSWGPLVIQQLINFGVVSKDNQRTKSCAGVTEYPLRDNTDTGNAISLSEYKGLSEDISTKLSWYTLLSGFERTQWSPSNDQEGVKLLDKVKKTLNTRYANDDHVRIVFSTLLPVNHCSTGACGTFKKKNDTWAITNAIKYDTNVQFGGHEMIITGYDDNAVAIDNEGTSHKGLLTIRNSWGDTVGNGGTYYITYDFFKQYIGDVHAIVTTHVPIE